MTDLCSLYLVTVVIPLSVNVYMLAFFMFFHGVATGSLDNGKEVVLGEAGEMQMGRGGGASLPKQEMQPFFRSCN